MKKLFSFAALLLIVACAQQSVNNARPAVYEPRLQPSFVPVVPASLEIQEDARAVTVRAFLMNQEHDGLDAYVESIHRNVELSDGYMKQLLERQEKLFAERLNFTHQWHDLYEKGKGTVAERTMQNVERIMSQYTDREHTGLTLESIEIGSIEEQGNQALVKTRTVEINNMPNLKGRRILEDTYVLENSGSVWKVVDVISNGIRLSSTPLLVIVEPLEDENVREENYLYDFRRVVGLSSI